MNRRNQLLGGLLSIVVLGGSVGFVSAAPVVASGVCPSAPRTLADLIAVDAGYPGPLTADFPPIIGVYAEAAADCWPDEEIELIGVVRGPEGVGGVTWFKIEPMWLVDSGHWLSVTEAVDPDGWPVGPFFPVAVPPELEPAFSRLAGRWVRVTGHFDDDRARSCHVTESNPSFGVVPTAEEAIRICRTSFVLTAVEHMVAPPTDTEAQPPPPAHGPPGWLPWFLAFAIIEAIALIVRFWTRREGSSAHTLLMSSPADRQDDFWPDEWEDDDKPSRRPSYSPL